MRVMGEVAGEIIKKKKKTFAASARDRMITIDMSDAALQIGIFTTEMRVVYIFKLIMADRQ